MTTATTQATGRGTRLAAPPPAAPTIALIAPEKIAASPFNHRKRFAAIDELAASLREKGMISPVTVRPADGRTPAGPDYELVVGERRWRAAKVAKLPVIPCIVRELGDREVLEIQLIENVQREDVHPLEEADGYRDLIDKHGYDVDQVAARTGKSRATIYARLKLCSLAPGPRKAFLEDKLNASVALLIARIPDPKLQEQATKEVLGKADWQAYQGSGGAPRIRLADGTTKPRPLSAREAQAHLQRRYMLRLELATFPTDDAALLPKAGACTTCQHRTGNQRELFADVKSADMCTNPPCFEGKKKAEWERKAAAATRDGMRVLSEKETKKVFDSWSGTGVQTSSPYVDPKDKLPYELDPSGRKTWGSLLGTTKVAKAVALDGKGNARTLIDKQSAIATLKKSGKLKEAKAEARSIGRGHDAHKEKERKREIARKRKRAAVDLALEHLEAGVTRRGDLTDAQWRWLATCVVRAVDAEDAKRVIRRRGLEIDAKHKGSARTASEKTLGAWIAHKDREPEELLALVVELLANNAAVWLWQEGYGENITSAAAPFGFELKKLHEQAVKAEKEQAASKKGKRS